jgi:hypothetical protein
MVGWTANKRLNIMKNDAMSNSDEELLVTIKKERFKLWTQMLFVLYIYNGNFALSYATWIMKIFTEYRRSEIIDLVIQIQIVSTIFLNPIVTIIFQPDINNEFQYLWIKFKLRALRLLHKIANQ